MANYKLVTKGKDFPLRFNPAPPIALSQLKSFDFIRRACLDFCTADSLKKTMDTFPEDLLEILEHDFEL